MQGSVIDLVSGTVQSMTHRIFAISVQIFLHIHVIIYYYFASCMTQPKEKKINFVKENFKAFFFLLHFQNKPMRCPLMTCWTSRTWFPNDGTCKRPFRSFLSNRWTIQHST